ncbi:response regulator [Stieleria sp. JC731]|uniref:response regulator n=1 Tax=Pirellulaceae TaxID=2691357 RepID=UPI001E65AF9C|nr:response regulator [Stieleria sp. JC731]MCC9599936.1 response regulator [Stieleria sp. JC731]
MVDFKIQSDHDFIIIDDDEMELDIVKLVYSRSRLTNKLRTFQGGDDFFKFWKGVEDGTEPAPAFVLIDVRMPRMSGFEIVERLRSKPVIEDQPHIFLCSNSSDIIDRRKAEEVGADNYVVKPRGIQEYVQFFDSLIDTAS